MEYIVRGQPRLFVYLGSSITHRFVLYPQHGRKTFTLQTLPPQGHLKATSAMVAKAVGFSLHAGVAA